MSVRLVARTLDVVSDLFNNYHHQASPAACLMFLPDSILHFITICANCGGNEKCEDKHMTRIKS